MALGNEVPRSGLKVALAVVGCATAPVRDTDVPLLTPAIVARPWPAGHGPPIGTAHPVTTVAADPHARWVVVFQAREDTDGDGEVAVLEGVRGWIGDSVRPWLVRGDGAGVPLDWYGASDPSGRWLALGRGGRFELHDNENDTAIVLDDVGTDPRALARAAEHPRVEFTTNGLRMLYLRHAARGDAPVVVVRELDDTQTERWFDTGRGTLVEAHFTSDGGEIVVTRERQTRVIDLRKGSERRLWRAGEWELEASSNIVSIRDRLVTTDRWNRLWIESNTGGKRLTRRRDDFSFAVADNANEWLVYTSVRRGRTHFWHPDRGLGTLHVGGLVQQIGSMPLFFVGGPDERCLVDLGTRQATCGFPRGHVLVSTDSHALLHVVGSDEVLEHMAWLDVASRTLVTLLPLDRWGGAFHVQNGSLVAVRVAMERWVIVDIDSAELRGSVDHPVLGLDSRGRVLVPRGWATGEDFTTTPPRLHMGPLVWAQPEPPC